MNMILLRREAVEIIPDVSDEVEVFLYTNLSTIISPNPSVLLTPSFQASLTSALNSVGERHNIALAKDLKDILDVFIIANVNIVVESPPSASESVI